MCYLHACAKSSFSRFILRSLSDKRGLLSAGSSIYLHRKNARCQKHRIVLASALNVCVCVFVIRFHFFEVNFGFVRRFLLTYSMQLLRYRVNTAGSGQRDSPSQNHEHTHTQFYEKLIFLHNICRCEHIKAPICRNARCRMPMSSTEWPKMRWVKEKAEWYRKKECVYVPKTKWRKTFHIFRVNKNSVKIRKLRDLNWAKSVYFADVLSMILWPITYDFSVINLPFLFRAQLVHSWMCLYAFDASLAKSPSYVRLLSLAPIRIIAALRRLACLLASKSKASAIVHEPSLESKRTSAIESDGTPAASTLGDASTSLCRICKTRNGWILGLYKFRRTIIWLDVEISVLLSRWMLSGRRFPPRSTLCGMPLICRTVSFLALLCTLLRVSASTTGMHAPKKYTWNYLTPMPCGARWKLEMETKEARANKRARV